MPDYIVNRAVHTGGTIDETGEVIAVARDRRACFQVSLVWPADELSTDAMEVFLSPNLGTMGSGMQVTSATPLFFSMPYYGAISARAITGTVLYSVVECFG
jgi:hypothetical protein